MDSLSHVSGIVRFAKVQGRTRLPSVSVSISDRTPAKLRARLKPILDNGDTSLILRQSVREPSATCKFCSLHRQSPADPPPIPIAAQEHRS